MTEKIKLVTVQCNDPDAQDITLHLEPTPTVFVNGRAQMSPVLADILVNDKGSTFVDANDRRKPKFAII